MEKESKTPETDAEEWDAENYAYTAFGDSLVVEASFARRLELERDEARKLAEECQMWHPGKPAVPWKVDKH